MTREKDAWLQPSKQSKSNTEKTMILIEKAHTNAKPVAITLLLQNNGKSLKLIGYISFY